MAVMEQVLKFHNLIITAKKRTLFFTAHLHLFKKMGCFCSSTIYYLLYYVEQENSYIKFCSQNLLDLFFLWANLCDSTEKIYLV